MSDLTAILQNIIKLFSFPKMKFLDIVEILIIAWLIYYIARWIKNTRAWVIVKGLIVILIFWAIASILNFDVIIWVLTNAIGVGITALIILSSRNSGRLLRIWDRRVWCHWVSFPMLKRLGTNSVRKPWSSS